MKRELGIARCGLACCICSENADCSGCHSDSCHDKDWCENRKCCIEKGYDHCFECPETECRKGMLGKPKPFAFTEFARKNGVETLLDCLERNEAAGVVYHRSGITGDYDIDDEAVLMRFIENGKV